MGPSQLPRQLASSGPELPPLGVKLPFEPMELGRVSQPTQPAVGSAPLPRGGQCGQPAIPAGVHWLGPEARRQAGRSIPEPSEQLVPPPVLPSLLLQRQKGVVAVAVPLHVPFCDRPQHRPDDRARTRLGSCGFERRLGGFEASADLSHGGVAVTGFDGAPEAPKRAGLAPVMGGQTGDAGRGDGDQH